MASPPQVGPAEPPAEEHLWDYFAVVLRHRKFALAIFLTAASVATIRTLLTRPVYMATAQILIERENPNVLTFKDAPESNPPRDHSSQTQYTPLQGRALPRRIVAKLNLLQD